MLLAGLDLAAEPKGTALAVIDWSQRRAELVSLEVEVSDSRIVSAAADFEKLGIDCALGWPAAFVDFVSSASDSMSRDPFSGDKDFRRQLAYRETDRNLHRLTGRWPLSVSTDRLGLTAIRAAGILSQLSHAGFEVDRTGTGLVVEVYPGATLRTWGFVTAGYRDSADIRRGLLLELTERAAWLTLPSELLKLATENCDSFDAIFASLAARAAQLGRYHAPSVQQMALAKTEGWLALPDVRLEDLAEVG